MTGKELPEQMKVERPPQYHSFFSNHFRFRFGPGDGQVTFSQLTDTPGSEHLNIIQENVTVTMSWPQLKLLSEYISVAVQEMERELGPIPVAGLSKDELHKQAIGIIKAFPLRRK